MMTIPHLSARRQRGIGLIEVLMAVVVLSLGFLAAARMQMQSLQFGQEAYYRSQANLLVRDMADRMRANRLGVSDGHYTGFSTNSDYTMPSCATSTDGCNAVEQAMVDKAAWRSLLHGNGADFVALLPSGSSYQAEASVIDAGDGSLTIRVNWSSFSNGSETLESLTAGYIP